MNSIFKKKKTIQQPLNPPETKGKKKERKEGRKVIHHRRPKR